MSKSPLVLRGQRVLCLCLVLGLVLAVSGPALGNAPLRRVSQDPYTNTSSFHRTEVEPDTFSFGSTIVSAFQAGRFLDGGASNIGWATSQDNGATWTRGFLPSTTVYATPSGPFKRVTDPAVAYDAKQGTWLALSLGSLAGGGFVGNRVMVNPSPDGVTWAAPVKVKDTTGSQNFDKTFLGCDNWPTSPNFGTCYVEWDDFGSGNILHISRSTDGGQTWQDSQVPNGTIVIGGMPLSLPDGTVVVPTDDGFTSSAQSFVSTDGGATFTGPRTIATFQVHFPAGGLRSLNLISADVDDTGKVYVTWYDCRFRAGCSSNDIVMSTSTNGLQWSAVTRIPIDDVTGTVDHFIPGIGVDHSTGGASAHVGLLYYFYPNANCTSCSLAVGFTSSSDGGATWHPGRRLAGLFPNQWFPNTSQGYMPGDYNSVSYGSDGLAYSVFATARPGTCVLGQITSCQVAMAVNRNGLTATGATLPARSDGVVASGTGSLSTLQASR